MSVSAEICRERFDYIDGKLYWKTKRCGRAMPGTEAGGVFDTGYRRIGYEGRQISAHKIIWVIHFGDIPQGFFIDHINGVRNDNRIENLRMVTHRENVRNNPRSRAGRVPGVSFHSRHKHWRAYVKINGKHIHLGNYDSEADAIKARTIKVQQMGVL
jgi:hypothetical protein